MKRIYLQRIKNQIARPAKIRDINRQIVLNYIRDRAPISRAEIARETSLQRSSVSAIVENLQSIGLIEETGIGKSNGGRKPTLLKIKSGTPAAIGVDITPQFINIGLADLSGKILDREFFYISPDINLTNNIILQGIELILGRNLEIGQDVEVGISFPGISDQTSGESIHIPHFGWNNWDIARRIHRRFGFPVIIDNDANAVALAELWFGRNIRRFENFISVLVSDGIGTGIIFEGKIYRGERGSAGEFGHMVLGTNAPVSCSCGNFDCWEAHASDKSCVARYKHLLHTNSLKMSAIDIVQLINLADEGEEMALEALKETARYIGIGLSNLIVGLSPQAIVVSGSITKVWHLVSEIIKETVNSTIKNDMPQTLILPSILNHNPTLMGAISLVLVKKFAMAL